MPTLNLADDELLLQGRYFVGEPLASSDAGDFRIAVDHTAGKIVTIRFVDLTPEGARQQLEREVGALALAHHPALPKLLDVALDFEPPFLVFERLEGQLLPDWLTRPLSPKDACAICLDLVEALEVIHGLRFIHQRMLPAHILMTHEGQPKILGFGLDHSNPQQVNGFLAPEYGADRDSRTDLYGAASVLYFLLTAHPPVPIGGQSTTDAQRMIQTSERTPVRHYRPALSIELEDFLREALSVRPDWRYLDATQFIDSLRRAEHKCSSLVPPPRSRWLGTLIAQRYSVVTMLGRGSSGSVFLAHDQDLDRDVAIKFVGFGDGNHVDEARAMAQISHPNVVQVLDVGETNEAGYIVMENVPGATVESRFQDACLETSEGLAILEQVARGLEALHRAHLVHGDVKPANILIGPDSRVCLADFGLVRTRNTWANPKSELGGTPAYIAPERLLRNMTSDQAHLIDVYSLGVMTFELLAGSLPFSATSPLRMLRRHMEDTPPLLSTIDPSLRSFDTLIASALAKDPSDRPQTACIFRQQLVDAQKSLDLPSRNHQVLIVDDDPEARELIGLHLAHSFPSIEVDYATTGEEALSRIKDTPYTLMLLDLHLGSQMNGMEVVAITRSMDEPPPIIVVTGKGSATDWRVLSSLGVSAFLFKPLDPELFEMMVRRVLAQSFSPQAR